VASLEAELICSAAQCISNLVHRSRPARAIRLYRVCPAFGEIKPAGGAVYKVKSFLSELLWATLYHRASF
jgi:hypothetical protein